MAVTALLFQMARSRIRKDTRRMWAEVVMAHAIAEYNSGRMKLATGAKECAVPQNASSRKSAEYGDDDNRILVAYKRNSALGFENEKFREHILKLQGTGYKLTLVELRRTAFKFMQRSGIHSKFSAEKCMIKRK
jgi:hypothetical protein